MSKDVRNAFTSFPDQAERALHGSDISPQEFYHIIETKLKSDKKFRKQVDITLKRLLQT